MLRFLRYTFALCALVWAIASSVSCSNDKFEGPTLVSDSANYRRTFSIDPGKSVKLYANFKNPNSLSFTWYIDGVKTESTEPTYIFSSAESGSYIITEVVENETATVMIDYYVLVRGKYDAGSFIFTNSGTSGNLVYANPSFCITESAYAKENEGKTLGSRVTYATMMYGKMYILSKSEGLIVANAITLKEVDRIKDLPANPNCLIGINRTQALLSTDDGVYIVNLNPLSIGNRIPNLSGRVGNLVNGSKFILALTLEKGIVAIDQTTLKVYRTLNIGRSGLAQDMKGNVWTSYLDTLYRVNSSLSVKKYLLPQGFRVYSSWNPWNEGSMCTSPTENTLFYVTSNINGSPTGTIIKINLNTIDNYVNSVYQPMPLEVFRTIGNNRVFSNIGLRISLNNNITSVTVSSTGDNPQLHVINALDKSDVNVANITNADPTSMLFSNAK